MLELDLLLRPYAENHFQSASRELQDKFLMLLEESDQDLQSWLVNGDKVPRPGLEDIVCRLTPQ